MVIVVGGPQYRAGSHRQFTLLARHIAAAGYPVLRFDARGCPELELGGARSRLSLRCVASAPLRASLRRETAEPPLLPVMQAAVTRFRLPLEAELVSLAGDSGTVMQAAGPCTGALVGEAGLRPRTSGGSGWEWFAGLRLEPAVLPVAVLDPLLGRSQKRVPLLDALPLVDWRLG